MSVLMLLCCACAVGSADSDEWEIEYHYTVYPNHRQAPATHVVVSERNGEIVASVEASSSRAAVDEWLSSADKEALDALFVYFEESNGEVDSDCGQAVVVSARRRLGRVVETFEERYADTCDAPRDGWAILEHLDYLSAFKLHGPKSRRWFLNVCETVIEFHAKFLGECGRELVLDGDTWLLRVYLAQRDPEASSSGATLGSDLGAYAQSFQFPDGTSITIGFEALSAEKCDDFDPQVAQEFVCRGLRRSPRH